MAHNISFDCVLWDFGDTLVDQGWLLEAPVGIPDWPTLFREIVWNGELGKRWFKGEISVQDLSKQLSKAVKLAPDDILQHILQLCRNIKFHKNAFIAVRKIKYPQAIVTVNPDIFTEIIVQEYKLFEHFDAIVTSWEMQTLDKNKLCEEAISRLGGISSISKALLIDNDIEITKNWVERGGSSYHFQGDEYFERDMDELLGINHSKISY